MSLRLIAVAMFLSLATPALAEPPGKPAFLQQENNADIAYCFIVLNEGHYKDRNRAMEYVLTAAFLWSVLEERATNQVDLETDIMPWSRKAVEEDVEQTGAPRLSAQACLDLGNSLLPPEKK